MDILFLMGIPPSYDNSLLHSSIHAAAEASLGMRQSPLGLRLQLPTFGPSGRHERLNCCEKKRRKKVVSHFFIVSSVYFSLKACCAK